MARRYHHRSGIQYWRNKNCCVRSVTVRKMGELSAIRNNGATRFSIQPWEQRRRNHESLKYIVLSLVAQVSWAAEELNDWWTDRGGWQENFERTEKNKYKGNFPWNKTSAEFNISFIDLLRLVLSIIIIARQESQCSTMFLLLLFLLLFCFAAGEWEEEFDFGNRPTQPTYQRYTKYCLQKHFKSFQLRVTEWLTDWAGWERSRRRRTSKKWKLLDGVWHR